MTTLIAVDLGNESGRIMQIGFDGTQLSSREVYRFPNNPVTVNGALTWDVLWMQRSEAIKLAVVPGMSA
jgi:rhamnulokinase